MPESGPEARADPWRDGAETPKRRDVARRETGGHIDAVGLNPRRDRRGHGPPDRRLSFLRPPRLRPGPGSVNGTACMRDQEQAISVIPVQLRRSPAWIAYCAPRRSPGS